MTTLEEMIAAVRSDAAGKSGVAPEEVVLRSAVPVTWSDGSLGCPVPGNSYTQALVPGYRIIVAVGTRVFDYHAAQSGRFLVCPAGRATNPREDESR